MNSPADVILTVDIPAADGSKEGGVVQPVTGNSVIDKDIPAKFRDPDGDWFRPDYARPRVYASKDAFLKRHYL